MQVDITNEQSIAYCSNLCNRSINANHPRTKCTTFGTVEYIDHLPKIKGNQKFMAGFDDKALAAQIENRFLTIYK